MAASRVLSSQFLLAVHYRLRSVFAIFLAAAVFLTVGQSAGYLIAAGLGLAFGLTVWAIRAKRAGFFVLIRFAAVVLGVATLWFLGVDESEFVEGCPDCNSRHFIWQFRLCGASISTDTRELRTTIDRALEDLGVPCRHKSWWRTHTHRSWGLVLCGYPCIDGTWALDGGDLYTHLVAARVRAIGKQNPKFAAEMHRRVIEQDDKKYFWEALMDDVLAPEWIVARNTREALSWLKGSSEADYRSLWSSKTTAQSIAWVEAAYAAGATKVFAAEIQPYEWDNSRYVNHVVVYLPKDPITRAQFFSWIGKRSKKPAERPRDYGQSFLNVVD